MQTVVASHNPGLIARVVRRMPLLYSEGADPALDRPAHVRAGSGLARIGPFLALVQDDANFLVLVEQASLQVHAVTLPAGADGKRQFDDGRGNKPLKLDLETCVTIPDPAGNLLLAFGSGSTTRREWVLVAEGIERGTPQVTLHHAPVLYSALRAARDFSGSEMNLEGAVWLDGRTRLFNRGNGAPSGGLVPVDATCELDWGALRNHLRDPGQAPPRVESIIQYDLGKVEDFRLGFTDATVGPQGRLFYAATAEDSPDAYQDGPVAGSALGVFPTPARGEWTLLRNPDDTLFDGKVEGVLVGAPTPDRAYVVVDRDDPDAPSELCEVELEGPWYG